MVSHGAGNARRKRRKQKPLGSAGAAARRAAGLAVADRHPDRRGVSDRIRDLAVAAPVQRHHARDCRGGSASNNYTEAFGSSEFWSAVKTTFLFTAISVTLELVIGLGMALPMHAAFRGRRLLRAVVLVPWAVLTVGTAITWRYDLRAGPRLR